MCCRPTWFGCRSQQRAPLADLCRWKVSARNVPPSPVRGEASDFINKCKTLIWEWNPYPVEVSGQTPMASASPGYSLELSSPKGLEQMRSVSVVIARTCWSRIQTSFHHELLYWVFNLTTCVAWVCVPVHRRWRVLTTCFARSVTSVSAPPVT